MRAILPCTMYTCSETFNFVPRLLIIIVLFFDLKVNDWLSGPRQMRNQMTDDLQEDAKTDSKNVIWVSRKDELFFVMLSDDYKPQQFSRNDVFERAAQIVALLNAGRHRISAKSSYILDNLMEEQLLREK